MATVSYAAELLIKVGRDYATQVNLMEDIEQQLRHKLCDTVQSPARANPKLRPSQSTQARGISPHR
jgi:hypothetical protein